MKVYYKNLIKAYSSEYYDLIYCYNPCLKYYYARFYSFRRQTPLNQLYTNIAKKYKDIMKLILRQKKMPGEFFGIISFSDGLLIETEIQPEGE